MLESVILGIFSLTLIVSVILNVPLLATLAFGYCLFFSYGLIKKYSVSSLLHMSTKGLKTTAPILLVFILIGMLTATWRAAGTIEAITYYSASVVSPATLVLASFILCAIMSMLTGSSFATAATMGVACYFIAKALDAEGPLVGGAILAGCFVGDRCSPLSSAGLLISNLTDTPLNENLRRIIKTAAVPFVLSCVAYAFLGSSFSAGSVQEAAASIAELQSAYSASFNLNPIVILPAALIVVLALLRVNMKSTMLVSLCAATVLAIFMQDISIAELPSILVMGYHATDPAVAHMVNGGGIISMFDLSLIVALASTYSGLFEGTGMLLGMRSYINKLAHKTTPFASILACSLAVSAVACDQIVALMLTAQLCSDTEGDSSAFALDLACATQIVPALVPWSTSVVGIASFVGMPINSIVFAFFCMLVPLWTLFISLHLRKHPHFVATKSAHILGFDERDCNEVQKLAA